MWNRLQRALHDTQDRTYQRIEAVVYVLIIASIALFAVDLLGWATGAAAVVLNQVDATNSAAVST